MPIACRFCIITRGFKGSEIPSLPQTDEELYQHIEQEHHIPIKRDGETEDACAERFKREQPEAGGSNCKCPRCSRNARYPC